MLFLLATFPPLLVVYLIYKLDKYEKEPISQIIKVFFLGCLTVVPVLIIASLRDPLYQSGLFDKLISISGSGLLGVKEMSIFVYAVIGIALVEEFFKYLVLTKYIYPKDDFNEPMDGIVYGVTVSMGFAFVENLAYIYLYHPESGFQVALIRMVSAIPAHALMGVVMGYYVGKAKFSSNEKSMLLKGLLSAIILHGLYDYFLMSEMGIGIFAFISLVASFVIAKKAINENVESSPFKE